MLKPQDLVLLFFLSHHRQWSSSYEALAASTGLSTSEAHKSVARCQAAGLMNRKHMRVVRPAFSELVLRGARYVFAPRRGAATRGVPTGFSAPPLQGTMYRPEGDAEVWPSARGSVRGTALEPLYRTVPDVAIENEDLYVSLALFDALRSGRARERAAAQQALAGRLSAPLPDYA